MQRIAVRSRPNKQLWGEASRSCAFTEPNLSASCCPLPEQTAIVRFPEYAEQRIRVFFEMENAHPFDGAID